MKFCIETRTRLVILFVSVPILVHHPKALKAELSILVSESAFLRMPRQLYFRDEPFPAKLASKGSFSRMRHDVISQLRLGMREALLAVRTQIRRLPLMRPLMPLKLRAVNEGLAAEFAQKRFFAFEVSP